MFDDFIKVNIEELSDNISEIRDCIKKYYPIGLPKEDEKYYLYSGIKELNDIIEKNIVDNEYYKKEWQVGFIEKLKTKLDFQDIRCTTAGFVPNFSGIVMLKNTIESRTELHFYKSLIGDYFTIEILENIHRKEISHPIYGKREISIPERIIVSPVGEYADNFLKVYQSIIEKYSEVKFLPYCFDLYKVNNLEVPYKSDGEEVTIAGAFFQKYSLYNNWITVVGDINYQIDKLK
ncbi:hypothetical protein ABS764_04730 [Flavobacterium sp. ST-87]|uniref:Uncharacterized protein n=1 Tax=Flavobacterium plantiphilum TaxID=3163297 RepID=A0ABW8XQI9_9FLAO